MSRPSPYEIVLTHEQRRALEQTARTQTAAHRDVMRAKIVLLAAEGRDNNDIAARLDTSPQTVHRWRKRFYEEGLDGLEDRSRTGRPPVFSALLERLWVVGGSGGTGKRWSAGYRWLGQR